jgi:peptidoglycan hydrolase-like protein with peptidoglycan-binding domain
VPTTSTGTTSTLPATSSTLPASTTLPATTTLLTTTTTTTLPTTTTTTTLPTTTTTLPPPPPSGPTYAEGDSGPGVLALQQRLSALGYWLGTPNGTFGDSTVQAVYALQKAAGISRDGVVGPITERALAAGVVPTPHSSSGSVVEIDLSKDLLLIVDNGTLRWVLNTSTGGGYTYSTDGGTAVAETPVGHFSIFREVDGLVVDSLGELWRPKFFDSGYAIHGDTYVPPEPVSHGCVRVSNEAIDWIWAANLMPIGTAVWVY